VHPYDRFVTAAHFVGIVHPRAGGWHYDAPLVFGPEGHTVHVVIVDSTFNVEVTTDTDIDPTAKNMTDLWDIAETWVRAALDALGYHQGAALDIELVSGAINGGYCLFPGLREPTLATNKNSKVSGTDLSPYLTLAFENPHFRRALADLRSAIAYPADAAFYAFRAVESIRQHYAGSALSKKQSWEALRGALGFDESDFTELTRASTSNRHGDTLTLTPSERNRHIRLAKEVVKRFVEADSRSQAGQHALGKH
jgi:hypothetical protein